MARPLRIEFPGAIYHVTSRMIGSWRERRERLFRDERDYGRFLGRLGERVKEFDIRLYLFCLMSNHFHLVLETPQANLSRFMHSLSTAYTIYYNLRHRRHGHLLDGRFKSKLVAGDEYLLRLSRYVHLNPVWVAGWEKRPVRERIERLRGYRWSSYRGYTRASESFEFVEEGPILAMLEGRPRHRQYRKYVERGMVKADEELKEALRESPYGIGDETFLRWSEGLWAEGQDRRKVKEDVAFRRVGVVLDPAAVMREVAREFEVEESALRRRGRNSVIRAAAAKCLIQYAGRTQREAAELLGLGTGAAVCLQLKGLRERMGNDRRLSRKVTRLEEKLAGQRKLKS